MWPRIVRSRDECCGSADLRVSHAETKVTHMDGHNIFGPSFGFIVFNLISTDIFLIFWRLNNVFFDASYRRVWHILSLCRVTDEKFRTSSSSGTLVTHQSLFAGLWRTTARKIKLCEAFCGSGGSRLKSCTFPQVMSLVDFEMETIWRCDWGSSECTRPLWPPSRLCGYPWSKFHLQD